MQHPATAKVSGHLIGIPDAHLLTVSLAGGTDTPPLRSAANADGSFELPNVPPGNYMLKAPGAAGIRLTVRDKDLVVELRPQYEGEGVKVGGLVENVQNFPPGRPPTVVLMRIRTVIGAHGISMSGGAGVTYETIIRPDGQFEFPRVPSGIYMMWTHPFAVPQGQQIEVADKDITNLKISVLIQRKITGRVFVEGGKPVPEGKIQFAGQNTNAGYYATIQADGSFEIRLHAGQYKVAAVELPVSFVSGPIQYGNQDVTSSLLIIDDEPAREMTVALNSIPLDSIPGFTIRGRTTRPMREAHIRLLPPADPKHPAGLFELAPDGTFEIPKVLAGTYTLELFGKMPMPVQQGVTVTDKDVTGVVLTIPPLFDLDGHVETVDKTGSPLPFGPAGMRVIFRSAGNYRGLTLRAGRTFSVALGEGEYTILLEDLPPGYNIKSITSGTLDLTRDTIRLENGMASPDTIRVVLEYNNRTTAPGT